MKRNLMIIMIVLFNCTNSFAQNYSDGRILLQFWTDEIHVKGETYIVYYNFVNNNESCSTLDGGSWGIYVSHNNQIVQSLQIKQCGVSYGGGRIEWTIPETFETDDDYTISFYYYYRPNNNGSDKSNHLVRTDEFSIVGPATELTYPIKDVQNQNLLFTFDWDDVPPPVNHYRIMVWDMDYLANKGESPTWNNQILDENYLNDSEFEVPKNLLNYNTNYKWQVVTYQLDSYSTSVKNSFTTRSPIVNFSNIKFYEDVEPNPNNSRNLIDAGKNIKFKLEAKNERSQNILMGKGTITSSTPGITVVTNASSFNNIFAGEKGWSVSEYEILASEDFTLGDSAKFTLTVSNELEPYGPWESEFSFPIQPLMANTVLLDDDNFPDSKGDDDDLIEFGETIEVVPLLDNVSSHTFNQVEAQLSSSYNFISIWDNKQGSTGMVQDTWQYNMVNNSAQPIAPGAVKIQPEQDYVFDYSGAKPYKLSLDFSIKGYWENDVLMKWSSPVIINPNGEEYSGSLMLVSPNGGEVWVSGSSQTITWTSELVTNTKLEYTTNNGSDWLEIIASTPATSGSYIWQIPNTTSTETKVKISDVSNATLFDESDAVFTIITPSLTLSPSNQNVTDASGSVTFAVTSNISWSVSEAEDWLSVSPESGSNNATLTVAYDENLTTNERVGTITVSGSGITREVTVTQIGKALPQKPVLISPGNNSQLTKDETIVFVWTAAEHSETYTLEIALSDTFDPITATANQLTDTTYHYSNSLLPGSFYWRVKGENKSGAGEWSDVFSIVIITDIEDNNTEIPQKFSLHQNYPNPFNPVTVVSYSLPVVSQVNIEIYNMVGQKVSLLVNENKPAGNYQAVWNAQNLPSGVYLIKITAQSSNSKTNFTEVKKAILMK
jgi:hypothetical protein